VKVGRPQLDLNPTPSLPFSSRRTVLYAPTWEGEDEMNNFTSLDRYGVALIEAMLAIPEVRVIYKPHPRVVQTMVPDIAYAHAGIVARIAAAAEWDPGAGHEYRADGDILALFPRVDLLVSDISSVGLDFLYSRADAPIVLTDRRTNRSGLLREAPIAVAAHIIDADSIASARADIAALLGDDRFGAERARLRAFYFDDAAPGESTRKFHEALLSAITEHQEGLARMRSLAAHGIWPVEASATEL
jgi:CDP-glycerol glycerophosphotransferase (TagB/SpsB family)